MTPLTPNYKFGHDEHLSTHHNSTPSHSHSAAHEGHSHNMRGVFLHVMAVSIFICSFTPNAKMFFRIPLALLVLLFQRY